MIISVFQVIFSVGHKYKASKAWGGWERRGEGREWGGWGERRINIHTDIWERVVVTTCGSWLQFTYTSYHVKETFMEQWQQFKIAVEES